MRLYASGDQYLFCIYILIKDITNWGLEMTRLIGGSQEILNLWINHFNDNNALGILDLYDQKATLVPPFSSTFATFGGRPLFDTFVNKELTSAPQFGQTMGTFPRVRCVKVGRVVKSW